MERSNLKEKTMSDRTEGILDILAVVLLLFTAMLDPRISLALAVIFLVALAIYKLLQSRGSAR